MNKIIAKRKEIIEADVIELDIGDDTEIRALKIRTPLKNLVYGKLFSFVVVEWKHPNFGYQDFGFFYTAAHLGEIGKWNFVEIKRISEYYNDKEKFLKEFPELKDLFDLCTPFRKDYFIRYAAEVNKLFGR